MSEDAAALAWRSPSAFLPLLRLNPIIRRFSELAGDAAAFSLSNLGRRQTLELYGLAPVVEGRRTVAYAARSVRLRASAMSIATLFGMTKMAAGVAILLCCIGQARDQSIISPERSGGGPDRKST